MELVEARAKPKGDGTSRGKKTRPQNNSVVNGAKSNQAMKVVVTKEQVDETVSEAPVTRVM